MKPSALAASNLRTRPLLCLIVVLIALKAILFAVDPSPRLFLGDSMSYLHSAATDWVPPDRSYAYPLFVRLFMRGLPGLEGLVIAQSFLGMCTALLLVRMLVSSFGLGFGTAACIAVIFALGPEQLFYERMVMTESASLFALACMLAAGLAYVRDGHLRWLSLIAIAAGFTVAFRVSLAPLALGFALLPVVARAFETTRRSWSSFSRVLLHGAFALLAMGLAHHAYKNWYDAHFDLENAYKPDYVATSGYFRLALVLPLVTVDDFTRLGVSPGVVADMPPDWNDRHRREALLWSEDGLLTRLRIAYGDPMANRIARKVATRALRRDVPGFLRLSVLTLGDYFDPAIARSRMLDDLGVRGPTKEGLESLQQRFALDASGLATKPSFARTWFGVSATWLSFCLFALVPLALATLISGWRTNRGASLLLAGTSVGLFAGHALFSPIVSFRYLHPFPLFVLLNVCAILVQTIGARRLRTPTAKDPPSR